TDVTCRTTTRHHHVDGDNHNGRRRIPENHAHNAVGPSRPDTTFRHKYHFKGERLQKPVNRQVRTSGESRTVYGAPVRRGKEGSTANKAARRRSCCWLVFALSPEQSNALNRNIEPTHKDNECSLP